MDETILYCTKTANMEAIIWGVSKSAVHIVPGDGVMKMTSTTTLTTTRLSQSRNKREAVRLGIRGDNMVITAIVFTRPSEITRKIGAHKCLGALGLLLDLFGFDDYCTPAVTTLKRHKPVPYLASPRPLL